MQLQARSSTTIKLSMRHSGQAVRLFSPPYSPRLRSIRGFTRIHWCSSAAAQVSGAAEAEPPSKDRVAFGCYTIPLTACFSIAQSRRPEHLDGSSLHPFISPLYIGLIRADRVFILALRTTKMTPYHMKPVLCIFSAFMPSVGPPSSLQSSPPSQNRQNSAGPTGNRHKGGPALARAGNLPAISR
jgi:hypothetical protein